ncbi:MAG: radical SAM protein [Spirochaetota bacterium]
MAVRPSRTGFCRQSDRMVLACATRHYGEEPPLIGAVEGGGGSGTLFFSGCTLRCGFCQNRQLSRSEVGREISRAELVEICLKLQRRGAENINLVSATPFIPSLEAGMAAARAAGLRLPVVWNSSGYELPETVERLAGFVDIFLPDLKLLNPELSGRLFAAADYPERATAAVKRMAELRPGSIIRHLVLPGLLHETRRVLEWFAGEVKDRTLLSLMVQFAVPEASGDRAGTVGGPARPGRAVRAGRSGRAGARGPDRAWRRGVSALENRSLTADEYDLLLRWLDELEIDEGFIQEPGDEEVWWPDFGRHNPFPPEHSKVVWSWTEGFGGGES